MGCAKRVAGEHDLGASGLRLFVRASSTLSLSGFGCEWLTITRKAIATGSGMPDALPARLLHAHCHQRLSATNGTGPAVLQLQQAIGPA